MSHLVHVAEPSGLSCRPGGSLRRTVTMALLMGLFSATWAQTAPGGVRESAASPASRAWGNDQQFMAEAAENEHAEIQVAGTALRRASNVQVRSVAQAMLQDHGRLQQELQALAATKTMPLPGEPSPLQRGLIDTLQHVDDAAFDRYCAQVMVVSQQRAILLFRRAASDAGDADLRAWAKNSLPVLEHHLQMARYLKSALQ
jgi:putative membrane protein